MFVNLKLIQEARNILSQVIYPTHLIYSEVFSQISNNKVYLKPENLQKTGSFKIRGAYNKIFNLNSKEKRKGIVAFSAGNHGSGTAYAAQKLGVNATIVMPENPVPIKRQMILEYGARVIEFGNDSIKGYEKAQSLHRDEGLVLVHPYDDLDIIAGQGTIGIEIIEELSDVDVVITPVSGGGLLSGVAAALKEIKPTVKIIGVNTEGAMAMYESIKNGLITEIKQLNTICDGLKVNKPGTITFAHIQKFVDEIVVVTEEEISKALSLCAIRSKLITEPSGVVALAAILSNRLEIRDKNVVVLLTGGNVNINLFANILERYELST